jgi:hypothetical protein
MVIQGPVEIDRLRPRRKGTHTGRREDVGVLAFVAVSFLLVIVGGAYIVWFSLDRYSLGGPGGLLAGVWAYSWYLVLRDTVEAILADDGAWTAGHRGGAR